MALMRTIKSTLLYSLTLSASAWAGTGFERLPVPGAQCGDGSEYSVYLRKRDPDKVLVYMEGGGACWNSATCFGPVNFTYLTDRHTPERGVFLSDDSARHAFHDYSLLFIPYCTGDFYVGHHSAQYGGKTVHHFGRSNVERSLAQIEDSHQLLSKARDVVLYGESAGALGVIVSADIVESYVSPEANKVAVVDSAGLHFSTSIWKRFSQAYMSDIHEALALNAVAVDKSTGILAPQMSGYCAKYRRWKVGFLQATQDVVMSWVFGNVTGPEHRARVLGKKGILQNLADDRDNCSAWVNDSGRHVFFNSQGGWDRKSSSGLTAGKYVEALIAHRAGDQQPSYR